MDELIGRNLTALRGDMSQKALADAMRDRGHKWSQATVWSVEKGERPLKLTEARDLEQVLDIMVSAEWFRREPGVTSVAREVRHLSALRQKAVDALAEYFRAQVNAWSALQDAWGGMPQERGKLAHFVDHALGYASAGPEWIVEEARSHAVGSDKTVIGGAPGDPYPHGGDTTGVMEANREAVAAFLTEVRAHVQRQEEA